MIFFVEFASGCTLVEAKHVSEAEEWAETEFGRNNGPYEGREASKADVDHVTAFGGVVHEAS